MVSSDEIRRKLENKKVIGAVKKNTTINTKG